MRDKNFEVSNLFLVTRYLVTTFKVVPRGTEGAVSVEGTFAGLLASFLLAYVGCLMGEVLFTISQIIVLIYIAFYFPFYLVLDVFYE